MKDTRYRVHILLALTLSAAATAVGQQAAGEKQFVGSQACADCHSTIYAKWEKTLMANILQDVKAKPEARNPKTGEFVFVPARRKVHFKPGKQIKQVLQQPSE